MLEILLPLGRRLAALNEYQGVSNPIVGYLHGEEIDMLQRALGWDESTIHPQIYTQYTYITCTDNNQRSIGEFGIPPEAINNGADGTERLEQKQRESNGGLEMEHKISICLSWLF
jgi:hypothetical protein